MRRAALEALGGREEQHRPDRLHGDGQDGRRPAAGGEAGKEFIELDAVIEAKAGRSIPEIFRAEGEIGFREREIEAAREVAGKKNVVIACGGGVVLNKINIDRLRRECRIVCLTASPAVILARTSADRGGRPLLEVADRATAGPGDCWLPPALLPSGGRYYHEHIAAQAGNGRREASSKS